MSLILTINTRNNLINIILQNDGEMIFSQVMNNNEKQGDLLLLEIEKLLKQNNIFYNSIDVLSITKGPASFTLLKILMSFAKAFRCCFPEKKIILNNLFELVSYGEKFDFIILQSNLSTYFINDGIKFFILKGEEIANNIDKNSKIITNSINFIDFSKNIFKHTQYIDDFTSKLVQLNYQKFSNKNFSDILEPLYIREPDINIKKKGNE